MQDDRHSKAREAYMHLAAEFLKEESNRISLITVTRASLSPSHLHGTIFITVYPEIEENRALEFLKRKKDDFREFMKKHVKARTIPNFSFEIDPFEKNRIRLDEVIRKSGEKN